MSYFVLGALGALCTLVVYAVGVFTGWRLKALLLTPLSAPQEELSAVAVNELAEKEAKRVLEENQAFTTLLGYNVNDVYATPKNHWVQTGGGS